MRRVWLALLFLAVVAVALWLWLGRTPQPAGGADRPIVLPIRTFALNLDPASMADIDSRKVGTLIYTGLIAVDQGGTVRPRIARAWRRIAPDTMEFELAPGVTFPDGTPVTAQKVASSLCASMQPSHIQSWSLQSIAHAPGREEGKIECTGLQVLNPQTIRIREQRPTPWLLEALAAGGGWIIDTDKTPGPYGVRQGTGPYVLRAVSPDSRIELRPRTGAAVSPRATGVEFRYVPEAAIAVTRFRAGELDFLEIDTPQIQEMLSSTDRGGKPLRTVQSDMDRVRMMAFNLKRLAGRGLNERQISALLDGYSKSVERGRIAQRSRGLARPFASPFPPYDKADAELQSAVPLPRWNTRELLLLTEPDPYSDMIAAQLPRSIGGAPVRYRTVDKGFLIESLLKGNYDAALFAVEATHHTPEFWAAFFTPGNPNVAFGTPIAGLRGLDLSTPAGLQQAARLIRSNGNWIGIVRDVGRFALSPTLDGLRFTGSGQLSFEEIGRSR